MRPRPTPQSACLGGLLVLTLMAAPGTQAATSSAKTPLPEDETAALLELAYRRLREGAQRSDQKAALKLEASAYRALEDVAATFDELIDDRGDLAVTVGGDAGAAWRGRPHERVMALLTLATLDVRRKRCDLALPTIKNAMHHRLLGRLQASPNSINSGNANDQDNGNSDDVVIASVLRLRCAAITTDQALRQEALVSLEGALQGLGKRDQRDDIVAIADAPVVVVSFVGRAPRVEASGAHGEVAAVVFDDDARVAFSITLGTRQRVHGDQGVVVYDTRQEMQLGQASARRRSQGAQQKSALMQQAGGYAGRAQTQVTSSQSARSLVSGALLMGAAAGLAQTSAVISARVDTRTIPSMPASISIAAPTPKTKK